MKLFIGFLFAGVLAAQTATLPPAFVGAGAAYNTVTAPKVSGWMTIGVQISPGLYSLTTTDMGIGGTSVRTGIAKVIFQQGGFSLYLHADAGVTTTSTAALGSASEGPAFAWKLPWDGLYAIGTVRWLSVASVGTRPVYEFGFAKSF